MEPIFAISNYLVLPFWVMMIALPRWDLTSRVIGSHLIAAPVALIYAALALPLLPSLAPALARPQLEEIAALLGSIDGATLAWVHFLAFDLLIGRWTYLDARERGMSAWAISPILLLTLLFGPLGYLTYVLVRAGSRPGIGASARRAVATNPPLALLGLLMIALLPVLAVGLVADARVVTGAPVWLKPAKFAVSIAIYSLTLVWLIRYVQGHRWLVALATTAIAASLLVEEVIIVLQAARGTTSHFNIATDFDAALWGTMGVLIVVVWLMTFLVGVLLLRQRLSDPTFAWGLRLGLLISLIGMAVAFNMTSPTEDQMASARSGQRMTVAGAHTVGAPDGGPGLPIVGWSTEAGDLRAAHFVGLHGLQVLPLVAWLISRRSELSTGRRVALVWTAGGLYCGLVLLLTWQALRGQSIVAPDVVTPAALAGLLAVAAIAAAIIHLHGDKREETTLIAAS